VLHVVQRGNDRSAIFRDDRDRRYYLEWLRKGAREFGVALHAYVLMSNHVHLLASPADEDSVPRMMHSLGRYVGWFNYTHDRTGTLWEGRYRSTLVDTDAYLLACMRYVELNPVRAGMVARPADYPWSSHRSNALSTFDPLVASHPLYEQLAATPEARRVAYARWCTLEIDEVELRAIRGVRPR
jgi:putative transposase